MNLILLQYSNYLNLWENHSLFRCTSTQETNSLLFHFSNDLRCFSSFTSISRTNNLPYSEYCCFHNMNETACSFSFYIEPINLLSLYFSAFFRKRMFLFSMFHITQFYFLKKFFWNRICIKKKMPIDQNKHSFPVLPNNKFLPVWYRLMWYWFFILLIKSLFHLQQHFQISFFIVIEQMLFHIAVCQSGLRIIPRFSFEILLIFRLLEHKSMSCIHFVNR